MCGPSSEIFNHFTLNWFLTRFPKLAILLTNIMITLTLKRFRFGGDPTRRSTSGTNEVSDLMSFQSLKIILKLLLGGEKSARYFFLQTINKTKTELTKSCGKK